MKKILSILIITTIIFTNLFIKPLTTFASNNCKYIPITKGYDEIYNFKYSGNGKSLAFIAKKNGKYILVKDGIESNPYKHIGEEDYYIGDFYLSYDGKSYAFIANKTFLVKDGIEYKYFPIVKFKYSPYGKSYAFITEKNGKWFIIKDGIKSNQYDYIIDFFYSPNGNDFYIIAKKIEYIY